MIKSVKNLSFSLIKREHVYDKYLEEIREYWDFFFSKHPTTFDGDVLSVFNIEEENLDFKVNMELIKYSYIVYAQRYGKIKTRSLFSSGYIITSDNYIGLVVDQRNRIDLVGGMASLEDISNNEYRPEKCLAREVKEEIGMDLFSNNTKVTLKYFNYPSKKENEKNHYPVGLIYEIKTDYTMKDIRKIFDNTKRDGEIKDIIFLEHDNYKILKGYRKRDYLDELLSLI